MGVNIAVGQQPDEMNLVVLTRSHHVPSFTPDVASTEGFFHLLGTLVKNAAGAHDVVSHLGITHVGIGGKTHCDTVGADGHGHHGLVADVARNSCMKKWGCCASDRIVGGVVL